jgi:hypothetical protein
MVGPIPKPPRKAIDLLTLIDQFTATQVIDDFVSPITGEIKGAEQSFLLGSFPKFLLIQVTFFLKNKNIQMLSDWPLRT